MSTNIITPSIWFHSPDGTLAAIIAYYQEIFGAYFVPGTVTPLGKTPSGNAEMAFVTLFGAQYSFMATEEEHEPLNDAFSLTLSCDGQEEIDRYWDYFTKEGKEVQCGWCHDKYGLHWQIVPQNLGELLAKPNGFTVMMGQKKIVIAEY
jgi:predicted 3-demethylubiquinone-9 3-methyltransferase (glyoxalase superfamily)